MTRRAFAAALAGVALPARADLPALHLAAARGETGEVARLLDAEPQGWRRFDDDGNLPLHHAAWNGQAGTAAVLLDRGAQVDALRRDAHPTTALEMASYFGHEAVVRLLLTRGADPTLRVFEGYTALHKAAQSGHLGVIRLLRERGAALDAATDDGRTALHLAARDDRAAAVRLLLALGADPLARDRAGAGALAVAGPACRAILTAHLQHLADADALRAGRTTAKKATGTLRPVYATRFRDGAPGPEWSTTPLGASHRELRIAAAPLTDLRLLGPFGTQEVRLAVGGLPPHTGLQLLFDLVLIGTWDGNGAPEDGPDRIDVDLLGGPNLLHTTFALADPKRGTALVQAYPGDWPRDHHPEATGADQRGTLGLQPNGDRPGSMDALYRMAFSVAHRGTEVVIRWSARGLEAVEDESWGLANVRLFALNDPAPPRRRK